MNLVANSTATPPLRSTRTCDEIVENLWPAVAALICNGAITPCRKVETRLDVQLSLGDLHVYAIVYIFIYIYIDK